MAEIINIVYDNTISFIGTMPKKLRKEYGQFFTSPHTADFMASLFNVDLNVHSLNILDAGAGSGILGIAFVAHLRKLGYIGEIFLVCYENDSNIIPILEKNLLLAVEKYNITFSIKKENYITSQKFASEETSCIYDIVIGNPPYKKISKDAIEAKTIPPVCYGAPNLYFLFWAMGINNLKEDGEIVYIVPRSWTSGAYFERFRAFLLQNGVITHIHLFGSRDKVFDGDSVLQETIIVKVKKTTIKPEYVEMTYSSTSDFSDTISYSVKYDSVVGTNGYVYLVTNKDEEEVLNTLNRFDNTLVSDNLRMKTGLIVDFRTREVLRDEPSKQTYPLLYSQHIKNGRVHWPIGKEAEYIDTTRRGFLQENTNYLLVKRFTAKEEKRRLQCGIYLKDDHPDYEYISTQNKVNFIRCDTPELAYGLFALMNSTIYDIYYRILNGSTQVNSTEINNMPVPDTNTIKAMGKQLMDMELTENNCNKVLRQWTK